MRDFTDITVILDRSGSMKGTQEATIKGFNQFVEDQRNVPGDACWTLVQFDDQYEVVFADKPQNEVPLLTKETYVPRGSTALLDAVCRTIDQKGMKLASVPENLRPDKVMIIIVTDGLENASREYKIADLNQRIATQRDKYNWVFVYLGANQDAIAEATKYGIGSANAATYNATPTGTPATYAGLSSATREYKTTGKFTTDAVKTAVAEEEQK